jgi:DnaK suppressor protein
VVFKGRLEMDIKGQRKERLRSVRRNVLQSAGFYENEGLHLTPSEYGENSIAPTHIADQASEEDLQNRDLALTERQQNELKEIDEALVRLEADEYGECEECGEAIGERRLEALPYARRCIECERQHEAELRGRPFSPNQAPPPPGL